MFAKVFTALALFAAAAQVAVAAPPACLIAAVNTQPNPADIKSVCSGNNATQVENYLQSNCNNALSDAMSAWTDVCGTAGITISTDDGSNSNSTSSSTSTSTSTSASSSGTSTTLSTITSSSTSKATTHVGTPSTATTASSSTKPTGTTTSAQNTATPGAASRVGMEFAGMAALGLLGAAFAL